MPVSEQQKTTTRLALVYRERPYQHTAATGVALYADGNYGEIKWGTSGREMDGGICPLVRNHRNDVNTGRAKNDAEVHVLNELAKEIFYWSGRGVGVTDVFLYVVGPHNICKACKNLIYKFKREYNVPVEKEYQPAAH